jgi:hypothetical protein
MKNNMIPEEHEAGSIIIDKDEPIVDMYYTLDGILAKNEDNNVDF